MCDLANLPRGLLTLEQWDALELDPTRRWELSEGTLIMQRPARVQAADVVLVVEIVSPGSRGTDHVMKSHEYAKAGIENYWIVDPDAPPDDRFLAYRLDGDAYQRTAALDGGTIRVSEPAEMEFAIDVLTGT
ncbi:Uma2 family endonuclease [Mycobacterium hubeiense]|uniref:Uma2 family endonuclease n=1 Tax=Mycobacterium hubeiense TaxID=1867256 RepID=UPI000C7EDB0B|nr:Uma2 family endonuclease [Mycobacterium sp. QGD 101]